MSKGFLKRVGAGALTLSPLIIMVVMYLLAVSRLGITYDEGYNLQIPVNLIHYGSYATNGSVYNGILQRFDPYISTGPTLLLPITIMFRLFGIGVLQYRLVSGLIFMLLIGSIFLLIKRRSHSTLVPAALTSIIACLVIANDIQPDFVFSLSAIGEPLAALLLCVAALSLQSKKYIPAGFAIGFAILTKLLCALALPAFVLILALSYYRQKIKLRTIVFGLLASLTPSLLFEAYRYIALGGNWTSYTTNVKAFITFFKSAGSGLSNSQLLTFWDKVSILVHSPLTTGHKIILVLMILTIVYVTFLWWRHDTENKPLHLRALSTNFPEVIFMLVTATLWIIWWFVLSDKGYLRHLWNAFILFLVSGGILVAAKHQHVVEELYRLYRGKAYALILISTLYLISLLGLGMAARYAHNSSHTSLDTQISGSKQIATYLGNQPLYNFGWWQNPDVQFLLQKSSQPLDESEGAQGWVIMESIYKRLLPQDYKVQLAKCSKTIVISNEYTLCWHGGNK